MLRCVAIVTSVAGLMAAWQDEKFRAFDKATGKLLWEVSLPAAGYATPSTYAVNGRQYVVIAADGGKLGSRSSDTYVAFALPGLNGRRAGTASMTLGRMMVLTPDMRAVIEAAHLCFAATVTPEGRPNLSPKGTIRVWDDTHLYFLDNASVADETAVRALWRKRRVALDREFEAHLERVGPVRIRLSDKSF